MAARRRQRSRQADLFPRSRRPVIAIEENHRLVQMTDEIDWTELQELVESIRRSKVKSDAGRPPHLRALTGALVFRATRKMTIRETEDQIQYYAPARYLCGLTETEWTPDANTIQDFEQLLGEDGIRRINEYVVKWAVEEKLADPKVVVADTTAQEAAIPHPNEMGLMSTFLAAVVAASKNVGATLKSEVQAQLARAMERGSAGSKKLRRYGKTAWAKLVHLQQTMGKLLPQIRYWLKTGHVAANKIINLQIPELYAIVRGKAGKAVEFGLKWGIARLRGGFLLATLGKDKRELEDSKFATRAVKDHIGLFGKAPKGYAYDRGGWSQANVTELKKLGVKQVGLAPRGKAKWAVSGSMKDELVSERAQVEAGIGTIKCGKYGFNKPAAKSAATMGGAGQRAVLGYNLNKLVRGLAERKGMVLVG